jgi:putative acetyltransferase
VIREARDQRDMETIADLVDEYELWLAEAGLIPEREKNEFRDDTAAARYKAPLGCALLAESGDEAAGCVALRPLSDASECEMKRLYVRPAFRASGVGRQLVADLIERARKAGYRTMRLDTLPGMTSAVRMYEQFGFQPCGAYHDEHPKGAIYFELRLVD